MGPSARNATTEQAAHDASDDDRIRILQGDCLEVMRGLPSDSVHAVITDPPYGLSAEPDMVEVLTAWLAGDRYVHHASGFMGKAWDAFLPGPEYWREVYRVLRPGGHLLCFAGTRTWDVMSVAIRLAGFENRDTIASQFGPVSALQWSYAQGFPKSLDVGKAIDKRRDDWSDIATIVRWLEAQRKRSGITRNAVERHFGTQNIGQGFFTVTAGSKPRTPTWEQWQQLKALLAFGDEMDAEVWRLNGRKGKPGEAWYERPPLDMPSPGMRESWTDGKGWNGKIARGGGPITDAAKQWSGYGSALKPAWEPVLVFRKPLVESSIAAQVLATGTGALNIGQSRVATGDNLNGGRYSDDKVGGAGNVFSPTINLRSASDYEQPAGRYPPNLVFTHALACTPDACADECPVRVLDVQSPISQHGHFPRSATTGGIWGKGQTPKLTGASNNGYADAGTASRYFPQFTPDAEATPDGDPLATLAAPYLYTPKASRRERNQGCEALPEGRRIVMASSGRTMRDGEWQETHSTPRPTANTHPCVKSLHLMHWLAKLVTPPGGVILDPFAGSGSTGVAAAQLGYRAILIEREAEYLPIIAARVAWGLAHPLAPVAQVTQVVSAPPIATPLTPVTPRRRAKVAKPAKRLPSNIVALSLWGEATA